MKASGIFFETIGLLMLLAGLFSDTTGGRDTHNIGLISDRETVTQVGGFCLIAGSLWHVGSFLISKEGTKSSDEDVLQSIDEDYTFLVKKGNYVEQFKNEEAVMKYLATLDRKNNIEISRKANSEGAKLEKYDEIFVKNLVNKARRKYSS